MKELPIKIGGILYTVVNGEYQFLLLKRTLQDGGFWQSITGTLYENENFLSCLKREIKEEIGITSGYSIKEMIDSFTWTKFNGDLIHEFVYSVYINKKIKPILNKNEHDDWKWLNFLNSKECLYTDNNKKSFDILLGKLIGKN